MAFGIGRGPFDIAQDKQALAHCSRDRPRPYTLICVVEPPVGSLKRAA